MKMTRSMRLKWVTMILGLCSTMAFADAPTTSERNAAASSKSEAKPQAKPAPTPERQEINLYLSARRALVMLRIGAHPPLPVVFDTGTNGNLLDLKLAERLGLPNTGPSPSIDGSTGKPVPGHDTFITGASLGGVPIVDARATALNYDLPDEVGIFGPNSFPAHFVEMDGPNSRLILTARSDDNLPSSPGLPYRDGLPYAPLDFGDGLQLQAKLDSGNDAAVILPLQYRERLKLQAEPKKIGYAVSAGGRQPIFSARLTGNVSIGGLTLEQPELYFMAGGTPNVGLPVLRRLRVIYDHTGQRAWIRPQAVPAVPAVSKRSAPEGR